MTHVAARIAATADPGAHSGADPAALISRAQALGAIFAQTAAQHDRDGTLPADNFRLLHEQGLLALSVPTGHGGQDAGLLTCGEIMRAVGAGEPATALIYAMQLIQHAVMAAAQRGPHPWPAPVYAEVAASAAGDGALINTLRVEPELGTPARGGLPATIARTGADGWRLSGRKTFCTGINVLRWLAVTARTDGPEPRMGTFLVPRDAPGIRVIETWDHLGLRASGSHDVVFEDTPIPAAYAVDVRPPAGWAGGPDPVHQAWNAVLLGSLYLGIAEAAQRWLAGYLHRRVPSNLGQPLATLPRMIEAVGGIEVRLRAGRRLLRALAAAQDAGEAPAVLESQVVKQRVTADAIEAVQAAVALVGNAGLTRANPLERHLRDVLCGRIHTPQDDSVFTAAGRAALAAWSEPDARRPDGR